MTMILTVLEAHSIVLWHMAYGIEIQTLLGVFCNVEEPSARLSTSLGMPLLSVSSAMLLGCTICLECTTHVMICHDMPMLCK
jgi:hypothetical protein